MRSHCRSVAACALLLIVSAGAAAAAPPLRICADPDQMPFSDRELRGFENRIASLIASDLGREPRYTWRAARRGFVRETLLAGACDVVAGMPTATDLALTTAPYYRSTYVFVGRHDVAPVASFDDPRLQRLRIGLPLVGDDSANPPPAHALAARGIVRNVRGYPVIGPAALRRPVDAVARGEIDLAVVWGPVGGFFAARSPEPLDVVPVSPQIDLPFLPMVFDVSMAVRRDDTALRDALDAALLRRRAEVDAILAAYGIPRLDHPARREAAAP